MVDMFVTEYGGYHGVLKRTICIYKDHHTHTHTHMHTRKYSYIICIL